MIDIIMKNPEKLYKFLIKKFGFVLIDKEYPPKHFDNFVFMLSSEYFLVRYVNDRSFLNIDIASKTKPTRWYDLALIESLLCNEEQLNKIIIIEESNDFLERNFEQIKKLFNDYNYANTRKRLEKLYVKRNKQMFPTHPNDNST